MSVVNVIDTLAQWVEASISPNILLKLAPPPEADEAGNYDYQLVHPAVFPMYVPTQEKLPPGVHSEVPSICVRFVKGADSVTERSGTMDVQLCLSAWNPGLHGRDILIPLEDGRCEPWNELESKTFFRKSSDGWRDVYNALDTALRAVESTDCIGPYTIDKSVPVEYGPLTEQETIPDRYPLWFAWIQFRVTFPLRRNNPEIEQYL